MKHIRFFILLILLFVSVVAFVLDKFNVLEPVMKKYNLWPAKKKYVFPMPKKNSEFFNIAANNLLEEHKHLEKEREKIEREKVKLLNIIKEDKDNLAEIEKKKNEIAEKEKKLNKLEKDLRVKELKLVEEKKKNTTSDENFDELVKIYSKMNAKKAANILSIMDDNFLIKLFKRMKPAKVSKILINLQPSRAAKLSKKLKE